MPAVRNIIVPPADAAVPDFVSKTSIALEEEAGLMRQVPKVHKSIGKRMLQGLALLTMKIKHPDRAIRAEPT